MTKLTILADAAKYDASCASSGATPRDAAKKGFGSTEPSGICHSFTPDGRCISLLKILLTNFCQYDCLYCINRASSNVVRARFTTEEVVNLTLDFFQRNCIEGLFLSSGVIQSPDYTMEQMVRVARTLRKKHAFRGYIHLKIIPGASSDLIVMAGRYADRLSVNIELPTTRSLAKLAPQKSGEQIVRSMAYVHNQIEEARQAQREWQSLGTTKAPMLHAINHNTVHPSAPSKKSVVTLPSGLLRARPPSFAGAGQSTQMIIGADSSDDRCILALSSTLYCRYGMRRVYYSAFSPTPDPNPDLPPCEPPLLREHRLYQADWLMRFYGFSHEEIMANMPSGMLSLEYDPKLAWALTNRHLFPVDLNTAAREMLLRVPGMGLRTVQRILIARRTCRIHVDDLRRQRVPLQRILPFVMLDGHHPGARLDALQLGQQLAATHPLTAPFKESNNYMPRLRQYSPIQPSVATPFTADQLSLF